MVPEIGQQRLIGVAGDAGYIHGIAAFIYPLVDMI